MPRINHAPRLWEVQNAIQYKDRANPNLYKFNLPKSKAVHTPNGNTRAKYLKRISLADPFAKGGPK